jgi:aminoglycoside 6'-N-acetyltransferase
MIIFLNGTSSAGKSTLARAIMRLSERPFLHYSIDHIINFWIDEKFVAFENEPKEWFFHDFTVDEQGNMSTHIIDGPNAVQLQWDMIEAWSVLIQKGYDLIIDEIVWQNDVFMRYVNTLCFANKVYLVEVACELLECERRESKRNDRFKGLARTLYPQVYNQALPYDLQIDTTSTDPERAATQLIRFIESHKDPRAFNQYVSQQIRFVPLNEQHLTLLQHWLNTEHVAMWWSKDKAWTHAEIEKKYRTYLQGYKMSGNEAKPLQAFIIECANNPMGYIQYYDVNDFAREGYDLPQLKGKIAAIDFYIGEKQYLNKSLGLVVLKQFINTYIESSYTGVFVDPDTANVGAIRTYENCGFEVVKQLSSPPITLMIKKLK